MKKNVIAAVLAVSMVVSGASVVFAEETEGKHLTAGATTGFFGAESLNPSYNWDSWIMSKLATTSSTGGLSFALQRAIVTARPKGQYRKHFYWPAIKRYYWNLFFSIPLLAHLYISELLHLLYCRLFQHNIL